MLHKNVLVGDNHIIHNWEVANAGELAALIVVVTDCGKIVWQKDTDLFLLLKSVGPTVWIPALGRDGTPGTDGTDGTDGINATNSIRGAFSGPVVASVGTMRYYIRDAVHVFSIFANLSVPAGVDVVSKIKKNGVVAQTVTIAATTITSITPTDISLLPNDYLTIDVIGGTGNDLALRLDFERV